MSVGHCKSEVSSSLLRLPSRPGSCCAVIWFAYCGLFVAYVGGFKRRCCFIS